MMMTTTSDITQDSVTSLSHETISTNFYDNVFWCKLANTERGNLHTAPQQSHFRVYTLFIIEVDQHLRVIEGTNAEQGYIGGAICAERSAIVQLRFLRNPIIKKIIITTDSDLPIYCGALCREYLQSVCDREVPVVLTNCTSDHICICTVGSLYPYPWIYRHQNRFTFLEYAASLSSRMSKSSQLNIESTGDICNAEKYMEMFAALHAKAVEHTQYDDKDDVHPLRLAAAVMFDNGEISCSWQKKGMEYGCTLDPVSQLVHEMEKKKMLCSSCASSISVDRVESTDSMLSQMPSPSSHSASPPLPSFSTLSVSTTAAAATTMYVYSSRPILLVMCDQFGICHAPVAMARSLLTEYGLGDLSIAVHNCEKGNIDLIRAEELMPHPNGGRAISGLDFR
jgi:cytidine deaminase